MPWQDGTKKGCAKRNRFSFDFLYLDHLARPAGEPGGKMRKILYAATAAILGAGLVFTISACNTSDDDNTEALALLALASGNTQQQYSDSAAALSGVTQSLNTNPNQVYNGHTQPNMLLARQLTGDPQVILTALTESSGSCSYSAPNFSCDAVVSGDINCASGGTATFTNVTFKYNGSYTGGLNFTITGPITYNNCLVSYFNYASGGAQSIARLNGDVNIDSTGSLTLTSSGSNPLTVNISQNETSTAVNNGLQINGNNAAFSSVTVITNLNGATTISSSTSGTVTTSTVTSTLTGSIQVNGVTLVSYDGTSQTATCTYDSTTGEFNCSDS